MKGIVIALIVALVAITGCVQDQQPIKELTIRGHNEIYTFDNDVREALKVQSSDPALIRQRFMDAKNITILFDGANSEDNAFFTVTLVNMGKIFIYFANEGKALPYVTYYHVNNQWYNEKNNPIVAPPNNTLTLSLKGPHTGATETSVMLDGNVVTVQGRSVKNLTLAGDKLTLIIFNVNETYFNR